jgi:DNA repair exonuclease SbcCD ATPase subunit
MLGRGEKTMRITYIKLKNFIGIYNGTGKTELEIDFSKKNKNRIIILAGENGSGKTTLLSTLHPFADTMDLRSDIILSGKDGYKEIHIEHEGKKYKIEHHYMNKNKRKSVKSFIAEWAGIAWDELNENGTVGSFKQIVETELSVDEGFFKLARIGKNVTNFIDLKTADRKKFISNFLPNIDEYLYYYKVVNEKWTDVRKNIKSVAEQIGKLDTQEHLDSLLTSTENQITNRTTKKERLVAKFNTNRGEIKTLDPDGSIRNTHNESVKEYKEHTSELKDLQEAKDDAIAKNPKFEEYDTLNKVEKVLGNVERKVDLIESDIKNLRSTKTRITEELTDLNNDLAEKEIQLSKYKTDKNLDEYKELKEKYEQRIEDIQEQLSDYQFLQGYESLTIDMVENYFNLLSSICRRIFVMSSKYDLNVINSAFSGVPKLEPYNNKLKTLKVELKELESKYSFYLGKQEQTEILAKRPSACKIDSCPFIQEALKYRDSTEKVDEYSEKIDNKAAEIEKLEKKMEKVTDLNNAHNDIASIYELVTDNQSTFEKFPNKEQFSTYEGFKDFFMKDKDKFLDSTDLTDFVYLHQELNEIKTVTLPDIERNIELLESKAELINSLTNDIDKIQKSIQIKAETLTETEEELKKEISKQNTLNILKARIEEYMETIEKIEDTTDKLETLKEKMATISETIKKIAELNATNKTILEEVESIDEELKPLNKELDRIKFNMEKLKEYTERKDILERDFGNIDIVKNALSPTKGIPLLFIDIYLKQTKGIANKLLDVAFKGKFFIDGFELTDKDFFIRAKKENGELVEDIGLGSQGETSLASLSLSLSLIQQSLRKYNVLLLDELDSELDEKNRRAFVEILESQFNSLGIEQAFLITHNKEFDTYPVDLILMPEHNIDINDKEYMSNKNILYKA